MNLISFIKANKLITALTLIVIVLLIVFIGALFSSKTTEVTPTPPTFPTPVQQRDVAPTINPDIYERIPDGVTNLWIIELPLKDPLYYVEYDGFAKKIVARLYPMYSRSIPKKDQIENIKKLVQAELISIGADLTQEEIEWIEEN